MIHKKYASVLFGLILSGLMSLLVSGISTFRATGVSADFVHFWMGAWLSGWLVAFPVLLLIAPLTRRFVGYIATKD